MQRNATITIIIYANARRITLMGPLTARDMSSDYVSGVENGSRIAAYLLETYRPTLLTLHVFGVDDAEP